MPIQHVKNVIHIENLIHKILQDLCDNDIFVNKNYFDECFMEKRKVHMFYHDYSLYTRKFNINLEIIV